MKEMLTPEKIEIIDKEAPQAFQKIIKFNSPFTVQETIDLLKKFNQADDDGLLETFEFLDDPEAAIVVFKQINNSAINCIKMEIQDKDGKEINYHFIDRHDGTKMTKVG